MQHPELGAINCKLEHMATSWMYSMRDGVDVDCTWIETIDDIDTFQAALIEPSPLAQMNAAASNTDIALDAVLSALKDSNADVDKQVRAELEDFKSNVMKNVSFSEFMRQLNAPFDQVNLLTNKISGTVDRIAYRAEVLNNSLASISAPAYTAQIRESAHRLQAAAKGTKDTIQSQGKQLLTLTTTAPATLADLTIDTASSITDLITLNPGLANSPSIKKGTVVRYFKPKNK